MKFFFLKNNQINKKHQITHILFSLLFNSTPVICYYFKISFTFKYQLTLLIIYKQVIIIQIIRIARFIYFFEAI